MSKLLNKYKTIEYNTYLIFNVLHLFKVYFIFFLDLHDTFVFFLTITITLICFKLQVRQTIIHVPMFMVGIVQPLKHAAR